MKKVLISVLCLAFLLSCSSITGNGNEQSTEEVKREETTTSVDIASIVPNRMLTLQLDGMVCQMGCGGSIRKELNATGGVSLCEFNFEDGRKTNVARISFDKDKITADQIVTIISELNDGQFTVGNFVSEAIETENIPVIRESNDDLKSGEETVVNVSAKPLIELPSLLDLFSNLLKG